ncbi:MAG: sugar phosphate isomerase/epimerase [Armatimonadetes bacterium]|nr:sugar phosphate isomerase/epimerase [Armatimonadota bacterium]
MITCLNPVTIGGQPPLREYLALAHKYGFGGVEFGIGEVAQLGREQSLGQVKALFDENQVLPAAFGLPVEWRRDRAKFAEDMQGLPELARTAQAIGSRRCCTWLPPMVGDDPIQFRNQTRDRFREIATVLGDHGIRFGLEWVGPYTLRSGPSAVGKQEFIWNIPATLELIADIDSPHGNVGLLADSFHWFTTGATAADMEALRPEQIVHVHINDAPDRPRDEQIDSQRLLPGEGVIDLAAFLGALKKIGYDGPVAVETFSKELPALGYDEASRRTAESIQSVMAGLA